MHKIIFQFEAVFVILNVNLFGLIQCLCYNQTNLVVGDLLLSTKSNGTTTRVEGTFFNFICLVFLHPKKLIAR